MVPKRQLQLKSSVHKDSQLFFSPFNLQKHKNNLCPHENKIYFVITQAGMIKYHHYAEKNI